MSATAPVSPALTEAEGVGADVPPPLLLAGTLVAGLLLHRAFPFSILGRRSARAVGVALTLWGTALTVASVVAMQRAGTSPDPDRPTTALVEEGPFRRSRNPIYLSFIFLYSGLAWLANAVWPLLLLPSLVYALTRSQIEREERYLAERFGHRYAEYRARVPRWL